MKNFHEDLKFSGNCNGSKHGKREIRGLLKRCKRIIL